MKDASTVLNEIAGALESLANQAVGMVGQEQSFAEIWGWNMPAMNRHEFADFIRTPATLIQSMTDKNIDDVDFDKIQTYPARIAFIQASVLPNLPGGNAFHVYIVIDSFLTALNAILRPYVSTKIDWAAPENKKLLPSDQIGRLRRASAALDTMTASAAQLEDRITTINNAHAAAESLPVDMEELRAARQAYEQAGSDIVAQSVNTTQAVSVVSENLQTTTRLKDEAESLVKNIDAAYSAATTQGLGKAFGDKADALRRSLTWLAIFLALTLAAGAPISWLRVDFVHELMKAPNVSMSLLWANVALTVVSLGAPIWLAWVLTKQIGQRFRLAEDYDFKASVAKAYEGYRREAANVDPEQAKRLFALALDRLSEEPLRHIERENHGTPFQEIAHSFRRGGVAVTPREPAKTEV